MAFLETPRLPDTIALGAVGGPRFLTEIAELSSGHEQRLRVWPIPRRRYTVTFLNRPEADMEALRDFFMVLGAQADGFRVRDWADYALTTARGRLGTLINASPASTGVGTGALAYQLYKRYSAGSAVLDQPVRKPVSGLVSVFRNAGAVTVGGGAGQIAIDYTTGVITFVPDVTRTISAITQANPGVVTATSHGFVNGDLIYIDSVVGMTQVNGVVFTIGGVTTNTFTLGVNTTTYTAYVSGGSAKKGPQPADVLTWSGEFDFPVRFDTDAMDARATRGAGGKLIQTWDQIELIEIRT